MITIGEEQEIEIRRFFGIDAQIFRPEDVTSNYAALIHQFGIKEHDRVLVIGGQNRALLRRLAKTVGPRGKITVAAFDLDVYTALKQATRVGLFKTFQPEKGKIQKRRSSFDPIAYHASCAAVPLQVERLSGAFLPFRDKQFHFAWVEALPETMFMAERDQLMAELNRVTRDIMSTPIPIAK